MMATSTEPTTLQTLIRGLNLLEAIVASDGTGTTKSLALALDIRLGTCYHLLRTLQAEGYVVRLPKGTYAIGSRAAHLSKSVADRTRPNPTLSALLWRLNESTRETTYVTGWYHGNITLQEWMPGSQTLNVGNLEVGYTGNLHARASAKAMAAFLPMAECMSLFPEDPFPRLTDRTILTKDRLITELDKVRRQGYAIDLEEFSLGVACVAAPFFDGQHRPLGAFAVSVPVDRFRRNFSALTADVRRVAARATEYLQADSGLGRTGTSGN